MKINQKAIFISVGALLIIGVAFTIIFNRFFGPLDNFPRLYKAAKCPDGLYTAAVYRRKTTWFCPIECIEVTVEVRDNRGKVVQSERITSLDVWSDMDLHYPEVNCHEDIIRIGGAGEGYHDEVRRQRFIKRNLTTH